VPPLAIVRALDVFEDFAACLSSGVPLTLDQGHQFKSGKATNPPLDLRGSREGPASLKSNFAELFKEELFLRRSLG
jgi:hypothetical protein